MNKTILRKKGFVSLDSKGERKKQFWVLQGGWKICTKSSGIFFLQSLKQQENTEVSWTKGKLMNNPLGVRSQVGFIFTHYIQKLNFFLTSKELTLLWRGELVPWREGTLFFFFPITTWNPVFTAVVITTVFKSNLYYSSNIGIQNMVLPKNYYLFLSP